MAPPEIMSSSPGSRNRYDGENSSMNRTCRQASLNPSSFDSPSRG